MATGDSLLSRSLHIPLAVVGIFALLSTVIAVLIVFTFVMHVVMNLFLGTPIGEVIEVVSVTQVVADLSEELYAWISGILLFIVSLPYFARYNQWLGRVLYDRDRDIDSEG